MGVIAFPDNMDDAAIGEAIDSMGPQKPKGALESPVMDEMGDDILRRGRAALGGLEAAGSMVSKLPGMALGGLAGMAVPGGIEEKAAASQYVQSLPILKGYDPQSEFGKEAVNALDDFRTYMGRGMHQPLRNAKGELEWMRPGQNGIPHLSPGVQTLNELASDVITDAAIPGRIGQKGAEGFKRRPDPTPQEIALAEAMQAQQEAAARAAAEANRPPPMQMEMDLPVQESSVRGMMGRVDERMAEQDAIARREPLPLDQQADLFEPSRPETFPGVERSEALRIEAMKKGIDYEPLSLADEAQPSKARMDPFRKEDLDYPLNLENLEFDPYFKTLKAEYDKAMADHWRHQQTIERGEAYGKTPRYAEQSKEQRDKYDRNAAKAREKADEALAKADEVYAMAEKYHGERIGELGLDGQRKYTGSMWEHPKRGDIKKDPVFRTGTKGRRQGGSVDLRGIKFGPKGGRKTHLTVAELMERSAKRDEAATNVLDMIAEKSVDKSDTKKLAEFYYAHPDAKYESTNPTDLGLTGPGKKQAGSVDLRGFGLGGKLLEIVPKHLRRWVKDYALFVAERQMHQEYGSEWPKDRDGQNVMIDAVQDRANELLKNEDFVKQVLSNSSTDSWNAVADKYKLGSKGKIGRQSGSIDFTDPAFLKFKDSLPEPLKHAAKGAWRKMEEDRKKIASHYGKRKEPLLAEAPALAVLDELPGLDQWKKRLLPVTMPKEEVLATILKEGPDNDVPLSSIGQQLVAGAKIYGLGTNNTLIRYMAQGVDRVRRQAQQFIENKLLNDKDGMKPLWERLSREEQGDLWNALMAREGLEGMDRNAMFDLGFNEKQVNAGEALRRVLDKVYDLLDAGRAASGKGPIERRAGYIPSRFRGDYTIQIRNADGKLVHIVGAQTKGGANSIAAMLREKYPDLTYSDVKHEPLHRFKDASDAQAGYQQLIDVLAKEDPLVDMLETAYTEFLKKQAYNSLGVKKHFLNKEGVKGSEGNKEWKDAYENAQEGIRSIMNYVDHAANWSFTQMELKDVRSILANKDVQKAQPGAVAYSQAYMDMALGRSPKLARALDSIWDVVAEHTPIGQSMLVHGIRDIKKFMTAMYLGFGNAGFSISQLIQVMQTQPALMQTFKGMGAEGAILNSYARGLIDATKGLALGVEKMTPVGQQAWKYASDFGIVESRLLDDAQSWTDANINKVLEFIATKNMTYFEKMARSQSYLTWVHFLHESGMKMGKELYEAAGQMTDITMVDYRQHERAMFYKQLGIIGETSNALTTFKHNYFSQAWLLNKLNSDPKKGHNIGPEATLYATLLMLGGLISMPGREDLDVLIEMFNRAQLAGNNRIPTSREVMLMAPEALAFGPTSSLSGVDISSKFSAANVVPDDLVTAAFPFAGSLWDMGAAAVEVVKDPSETSFNKLRHQMLPNAWKWAGEDLFEKNNIMQDPKTLEGKFRRTPGDRLARKFALRSMDESKSQHDMRTQKSEDNFYTDRRASILGKAHKRAFEGNMMALGELARQYAEAEGDVDSFVNAVIDKVENQHRTQAERMINQAMNNPQKLRRRMGKK